MTHEKQEHKRGSSESGVPTGRQVDSADRCAADGLEVDLLMATPAGYVAVEIKQSSAVSRHDARHLMAIDGILDEPVACRLVVAQSKSVESLGGNAYAVPVPWLLG